MNNGTFMSIQDLSTADFKLTPHSPHSFKFDTSLSPRQALWTSIFVKQWQAFDQLFQSELGCALKDVPLMDLKIRPDCINDDVFCNPRPTTPAQATFIRQILDKMLKAKIETRKDDIYCNYEKNRFFAIACLRLWNRHALN